MEKTCKICGFPMSRHVKITKTKTWKKNKFDKQWVNPKVGTRQSIPGIQSLDDLFRHNEQIIEFERSYSILDELFY
jgi:hypothetical protein